MHGLFGKDLEPEELDIIKHLVQENRELTRINRELVHLAGKLLPASPNTHKIRLVLKLNNNQSTLYIMALSIAANQAVSGTLALVDEVTSAPVSGTFTGTGAVSDTPAAFTASVDAGGNVNVTAVAAGTGNLTVTTTAAYTDSTGAAQSVPLSVVIPVSITAVVTADAVALTVNFGNPTAAPASTPAAS